MNHFTAFFHRAHARLMCWKFTIQQRAWNWWARRKGWETCHVCDDTRGGTIGNGQWVDGVLMCDYCHVSHMKYPRFWEVNPQNIALHSEPSP